jgi:UDP-N-acetylmuramyl pentapeptide phosphotransferase/UDP-N-acetylglucosamine-1-phosphate transferase
MGIAMPIDPKSPAGGGCLIFAGFMVGSLAGISQGQASYGAIAGVLAGIVLVLLLWALGRKR